VPLSIIYQDEYLVVINKPHGLLVHRSPIAADATEFALQLLRDQLGQKVYLVHRIDRKTSGVLVFALSAEVCSVLGKSWQERKVDKTYLAIVRGWPSDDESVIDYELANEAGTAQQAVTRYRCLQRVELPVAYGRYTTSRYTLVEAYPETGRMHQIRRHLSHIRYPIVGDRPHGCSKQNRLWKSKWKMTYMMLHARAVTFHHPITARPLTVVAPLSAEMERVCGILNLQINDTHAHTR